MPEYIAAQASLFWSPDVDLFAVRAAALSCSRHDPEAFDLRSLSAPAKIFRDGQSEEVAIGSGRGLLRLSIGSGTLLDGPVRLVYELAGRRQLGQRLFGLGQLDAVMRLGRVPRPLAIPAVNSSRSMAILRTINVLADGGRARGVAEALFGAERVEKDWRHESDYLRMKTRRLIDKSRRLVAGGYLALLGGGR